ncbi:MAG TPA: hypothetical protein VN696_02765, partial [Pyrinomonadaceae bacterium]|nr:hypothetical protein [Pyrinomonadaceae bacterium]
MLFRSAFNSLRFILIIASLWLLWAPARAWAQDASQQERPRRALPAENEPQDILKIDTDLVPLDVIATDTKGRLVRNLTKDDFKLFEDGVARPIASFNMERISGEPRPLAIVFALDISGSMTAEELQRLVNAMREFSRRLVDHPAVFGVMTFGTRVKTLQSL